MTPLEERLRRAGVPVTAPGAESPDEESPWYVRALAAASGWLASLFLMGFFGVLLAQLLVIPFGSLITGLLLITGAYFAMRAEQHDFLEHAGLAVSLAGQGFVIWSLYRFLGDGSHWFFGAVAIFELILTVLMPATVHRFVTTLIAALSVTAWLAMLEERHLALPVLLLATVILWSGEFRRPGQVRFRQAVGYGIVLALVMTSFGMSLVSPMVIDSVVSGQGEPMVGPWLASILSGVILVSVLIRTVRALPQSLSRAAMMLTGLGILIAFGLSLMVPGLVVGVTLLLIGFAGRQSVLQGLGILALLGHVSAYYYHLDATLIEKSGLLMVVGLGLLVLRWIMRRFVTESKEVAHG